MFIEVVNSLIMRLAKCTAQVTLQENALHISSEAMAST